MLGTARAGRAAFSRTMQALGTIGPRGDRTHLAPRLWPLARLPGRDLLGRHTPPHERITPDTVRAYIEELEALGVRPNSRLTYMVTLRVVAEAFAPDRDRGWLRGIVRKLDRRKRPVRDKFRRLRPAHEIAGWAYARMREIERQETPGRQALVDYRNALCVAHQLPDDAAQEPRDDRDWRAPGEAPRHLAAHLRRRGDQDRACRPPGLAGGAGLQ